MNQVVTHLSKDTVMKRLIAKYGFIGIQSGDSDIFIDLVESIINQQLSNKAAATIFGRFKKLFPNELFSPDLILSLNDETVRKAGISYSKITYIKGLSQAIKDKVLSLELLSELEDEEVIVQLTKIKGIGRWTAEMILMFSLKRPDVFSMGDIGLRTAVANLYNVDKNDLEKIEKISLRWKPYRTYASRYLWRSLE